MSTRCRNNPSSSIPLAIAFLPHWRWLICQAGYANVLPPPGQRVGKQKSDAADEVPVSSPGWGGVDGVWGVLYRMDARDEGLLDGYEGVDVHAGSAGGGGGGARVVRWLVGDGEGARGDGDVDLDAEDAEEVDVLVYVDENRVVLGPPRVEYIGRMNRAIKECVELGVDEGWIEGVVRRFIPIE
ncbi:hypothetical protein N7533_003412 [Penicillium manginii]|uniref:uncharacterized protein n=1 Tax=Penicillium manginii TaxID=203109 RepID=UPI0025469011|nr:uncharacterized protein N7533_003412 [Penicillium manginii]KAJ5761373.1 hypothetical protein N7533_003412 [Penicillium manginii]